MVLLSGVVVHGDGVTGGAGLAGEHVTGGDLVGLQGVVLIHLLLTLDHLGATGSADSASTGEGNVRTGTQGCIENGFAGLDR